MAYFAKCDFPAPDPQIMGNMAAKVSEEINDGFDFVRPGDSACTAAPHLARTIARRAERAATPLFRDNVIEEKSYICLNRLSDLIYILSLRVGKEGKGTKPINRRPPGVF